MKEKKPINIEIGLNVKQVRESAGLTQESFAELIGLGVNHISAIECGAAGVSLAKLKKICSLLSVSADTILFGTADTGSQKDRDAAISHMTERISRLPDNQFWGIKVILDKMLEVMAMNRQPCDHD